MSHTVRSAYRCASRLDYHITGHRGSVYFTTISRCSFQRALLFSVRNCATLTSSGRDPEYGRGRSNRTTFCCCMQGATLLSKTHDFTSRRSRLRTRNSRKFISGRVVLGVIGGLPPGAPPVSLGLPNEYRWQCLLICFLYSFFNGPEGWICTNIAVMAGRNGAPCVH